MDHFTDRARGALAGFILGDSLGIPTQGMTEEDVVTQYGLITGLGDAWSGHPLSPGAPAGSVSARTGLMLLTAGLIDENGIDTRRSITALRGWRDATRAGDDVLGPNVWAAVDGQPVQRSGSSTADSAAMAVPIGIAQSLAEDRDRLLDTAARLCSVTGETHQSIEAAMLAAATVSAAVDGASIHDAVDIALAETASAGNNAQRTPEASVIARTLQAIDWSADLRIVELIGHLHDIVGLSNTAGEAVPAAIVLAKAYARDPYRGLCAAAQLGGESCLIGSLTGALLGAASGIGAFPASVLETLDRTAMNVAIADRLLAQSGRGSTICGAGLT